MAMLPAQTFFLLCRTVADVTGKNTSNGHNLPLLLLFHIVMNQRNLAFPHEEANTRALASYMTMTFATPKIEEAVKTLADAFRVPHGDLDLTARVKSSKHIQNQPFNVHVEQAKAMINPEQYEWAWLARNLRLRETLVVGSPRSGAECPRGLSVENINLIKMAVEKADCMPLGCTSVLDNFPGGADGQTTVVKLEWSWKSIHEPDDAFAFIIHVLQTRFLGGLNEEDRAKKRAAAAADASENGSRTAAPAGSSGVGSERPPSAATRRGTKRGSEEDPVVPVDLSVRRFRHPKAAAKFEKTIAAAADALVEEETCTTVVRVPYVVGQVEPFSAWPHGGVVVFAHFPFLLNPFFQDGGRLECSLRKLLAFDVGGSYEEL
eukprot:contig_21356_g5253